MFEDAVIQVGDTLASLTAALTPDTLTEDTATAVYTGLDRIERLAWAGKTLLAPAVAAGHAGQAGGGRTGTDALARRAGTGSGAARDQLATGHALEGLPALTAALRGGHLSATQACLIAAAASADPAAEHRLLALADQLSVAELRTECARVRAAADPDPDDTHRRLRAERRLRRYTDGEGGWNLTARGTPADGAAFNAVLDPLIDAVFRAARAAGEHAPFEAHAFDALMALADLAADHPGEPDRPDDDDDPDHPDDHRDPDDHGHPDEPGTPNGSSRTKIPRRRGQAGRSGGDPATDHHANPGPVGDDSGVHHHLASDHADSDPIPATPNAVQAASGAEPELDPAQSPEVDATAAGTPAAGPPAAGPPAAGLPPDGPGESAAAPGPRSPNRAADSSAAVSSHARAAEPAPAGPPRPANTSPRRRRRSDPRYLALLRVDLTALHRGRVTGDELCEIAGVGPIPVTVARDLLGQAVLKLVITRGVDVAHVTHLGRGPTAAQRVALAWTSPQCSVLGCSRTHVQIDHRLDWAGTRHTRLGELDPLCPYHHDLKTRHGWALVPGTGRRTFVPPHDPHHPSGHPGQVTTRTPHPHPAGPTPVQPPSASWTSQRERTGATPGQPAPAGAATGTCTPAGRRSHPDAPATATTAPAAHPTTDRGA